MIETTGQEYLEIKTFRRSPIFKASSDSNEITLHARGLDQEKGRQKSDLEQLGVQYFLEE